jgi:hypothetical protein
MKAKREIHPHFLHYLQHKEPPLIALYTDLRDYILDIYPKCNELVYHTHALTSVFTISDKLGDAFCMINIYANHLNLGFNKGTLLKDPNNLLEGTGKLIRHIAIEKPSDYRTNEVKELINNAVEFAISDATKPSKVFGTTISKIKV